MSERKYQDEEVRQIIEGAALSDGLTLAEIQSIAKEVGIAEDDVARAASMLDAPRAATRKNLGMPIGVNHTAALSRTMTDEEWEQLVAAIRETFNAKGRVTSTGSIREWSNGNLRVYVEPTKGGHRVRMTTRKGNAIALNTLGIAGLLGGTVLSASTAFMGFGLSADAVMSSVLLFGVGVGALASNFLRLPGWAERRLEQMQRIGQEAQSIVDDKP